MLNRLKFKVQFASTDKLFEGTHEFQTGMTAITGKNEAGKSLRLEMIRYALFGSKALRSDAKSYKRLEVKLQFTVGVNPYEVHRIGNKHRLMLITNVEDPAEIATGVKPVNDAIIKIFGYDLEVFDVANAVMQDEIASLSRKTPTERKRMVDRTIGLDAVDRVLKGVADEAATVKKAIDMLKTMVLEQHTMPVCPVGVSQMTVAGLESVLADLRAKAQERQFLEGQLKGAEKKNPGGVIFDKPIIATYDELRKQYEEITERMASMNSTRQDHTKYSLALTTLKHEPSSDVIEAYHDGDYDQKWRDYKAYEARRVDAVLFSQQDIDELRLGMETEQKLAAATETDCPSCGFHLTLINGQNYEGEGFSDRYDNLKKIFGPLTPKALLDVERQITAWEAFAALPEVPVPDINPMPNNRVLYSALQTMAELRAGGYQHDAATELLGSYDQLKAEQSRIVGLMDSRSAQDLAVERHRIQCEEYEKYLQLLKDTQPKLDALAHVPADLVEMQERYLIRRKYETELAEYNAKQASQEESLKNLKFLEDEEKELQKVKKALTELKPKVKLHLLPSLNKVASSLLSQMTNSERNSIEIDEEFDIKVDGQQMVELSGSAKAVANLAVRIGLGMVLTNRVFSVLLADEIDAAMDDTRAAYTAACIRNLYPTIGQIMLISHKEPEADNLIEL